MAVTKPALKGQKPMSGARPMGAGRGFDPATASLDDNIKRLLADEQYQDTSESDSEPIKADASEQAPLILLVNSLITEAIRRNASDIHIEPFETMVRVRFRIDGTLIEIQKVPIKIAAPLLSRLKIMADLDICEKRVPQDGCIRFKHGKMEADLRISTLPSVFGEKAVMRVLGKTNLNNDLSKLGMPEVSLKPFRKAISKPDGLILVTGPTGSGKTTTLYAAINEVNEVGVSVFTAEDPVEGTIAGVTQCQANPTVGYTFASILRSFLRQDPDIILVGEIRDQETAEIAMKAALTGHQVLSTLHTNCAASTISRLLDMNIPAYLVASAISCIVAQRLVRRICESCKQENILPEEALAELGVAPGTFEGNKVFHGRGCSQCHNTGYKGRAPIYEVLSSSDEIRRLIVAGASKSEIKIMARRQGMTSLREAGIELVRQGITTIDEVVGVTNEDDETLAAPAITKILTDPQAAMPAPALIQPVAVMTEVSENPQVLMAQAVSVAPQVSPEPVRAPVATEPAEFIAEQVSSAVSSASVAKVPTTPVANESTVASAMPTGSKWKFKR